MLFYILNKPSKTTWQKKETKKMNSKMWLGIVVAIIILGGGVWAIKNKSEVVKNKMEIKDEKKMEDTVMKDKEKDMMSDSKILGVYMRDGKLLTIWPRNELWMLEKNIVLKNGTKVMLDGKIVKADGSMIALVNDQVLNADGSMTTANKELMSMKVMTNEAENMPAKNTMAEKNSAMMTKSGAYKDYSQEVLVAEQKAGQKVVLFFHASWCPYCKAADTAFKANSNKIPAGVTVLKTDYDSNQELKTKFGVTTQHTFVQIDNNGNLITKWVSGDVDTLKANIK